MKRCGISLTSPLKLRILHSKSQEVSSYLEDLFIFIVPFSELFTPGSFNDVYSNISNKDKLMTMEKL